MWNMQSSTNIDRNHFNLLENTITTVRSFRVLQMRLWNTRNNGWYMKKCTTYDNNIFRSKWTKNTMDNGRRNKIFDTKWIAWWSKMIWKKHEMNYANEDESNTSYGIEWIEKHEMTFLYMLLYFFCQLFTIWSTRRRKWWYYWMNMNVSFISTFQLIDLIWCNIP